MRNLNLNKQKILEEGLREESIVEEEYFKFLDLHKFNAKIKVDGAAPNFRVDWFYKNLFSKL